MTVSVSGLSTVFDCRCAACGSDILRLHCLGGGTDAVIGVLMPEAGGLHLQKRLTRNALMRLGLSSIESCHLSSASQTAQKAPSAQTPAWRTAAGSDLIFEDGQLTASCRGRTDLLARGTRAQLLLAVPVAPDAPFPLMPVFRYGDTRIIDGQSYVVFALEDGKFIQSVHNFPAGRP